LLGGRGVKRDLLEARKLAELSAEQHEMLGERLLAFMLENGLGGPKDMAEAIKWYRSAAEAGDPIAKESLAKLEAAASQP
jgi:TPR repeat protein